MLCLGECVVEIVVVDVIVEVFVVKGVCMWFEVVD